MGAKPPDCDDIPEPPRLRQLRRLVVALTVTLIVGVITIALALVIRLARPDPLPELPTGITLPAGETARAVTFGTGWVAVVTADAAGVERIRVLDSATGVIRAVTEVQPAK